MQMYGIKSLYDNKLYPGGLSPETFIGYAKGYNLNVDLEESTRLRQVWLDTYPEMEQHLKPSRSAEGDWYIAVNSLGTIRGRCSFTESCNYVFQSLVGAGLKRALWKLLQVGAPMCNEVHDEVIYEIPMGTPKEMTEVADWYASIQVDAMREILPDINVKADGALMDRWYKKDGERDGDGNLKVLTEEAAP